MTVSTIPATCPACGTSKSVYAIYIKCDDDLICPACIKTRREGAGSSPQDEPLPPAPFRRFFGRR